MDIRLIALKDWIVRCFAQHEMELAEDWVLSPLCGDASYRRYFRLVSENSSWIVMDAPPEGGDSASFVDIASGWKSLGINLPKVLSADLEQGFLLLSDLGDLHYLDHLNDDNADDLYGQAIAALIKIQGCQSVPGYSFPVYDRQFITRELAIFSEWFVGEMLGLELSESEQQCWTGVSDLLINSALEQPQVCMHRDYHSRNLMVTKERSLGIIDFQDAVMGPISYDLVSLLRDCYIEWPQAKIERWVQSYLSKADSAGIISFVLPASVSSNSMVAESDQFKEAALEPLKGSISEPLRASISEPLRVSISMPLRASISMPLKASNTEPLVAVDEKQFFRWFDLMGMQRHLKAVGIFARLKIRDGKDGYLADIPRTLNYVLKVCDSYPELEPFYRLLTERIVPQMRGNSYLDAIALEPLG